MTPVRRFAVVLVIAVVLLSAASAFAAPGGTQATVTGTVSGSDGITISGATVTVSLADRTGAYVVVANLTTGPGGSWTYAGKAGNYKFDFAASFSDSATQYLTMANKSTYTLNVTLQSYGTIAGAITDSSSGLPLGGATVELFKRNADGTWPMTAYESLTTPDGAYAIGSLPTGTYRVKASAIGYVAKFYGESALSGPVDLIVNRGSGLTANIALVPAASGTATISGRVVSGALATPMAGAYVWLYKQNADGTWPNTGGTTGWGSPTFTVFTNSAGDYTTGDLPVGNYMVRFFTLHTGSQWWQYVATVDLATVITLAPGDALAGIDGWFNKPL